MARLIAKEIVKRYRKRVVVDAASLEVASGEVVGLLGPNGAGKTTSFYMMVGLIQCDEGRVLLDESDLTHLPMHARARLGVGYLPQEPSIFRQLTVLENVLAILEMRRDLGRPARRPVRRQHRLPHHPAHHLAPPRVHHPPCHPAPRAPRSPAIPAPSSSSARRRRSRGRRPATRW